MSMILAVNNYFPHAVCIKTYVNTTSVCVVGITSTKFNIEIKD